MLAATVATAVDNAVDPFVSQCLAVGFTPDPERWLAGPAAPPWRVAVNWVRWTDGRLFLAVPKSDHPAGGVLTAKGLGQLPGTFTLDDFSGPTAAPPDIAPPNTAPPVANVPRPARRFVQRSLFE